MLKRIVFPALVDGVLVLLGCFAICGLISISGIARIGNSAGDLLVLGFIVSVFFGAIHAAVKYTVEEVNSAIKKSESAIVQCIVEEVNAAIKKSKDENPPP